MTETAASQEVTAQDAQTAPPVPEENNVDRTESVEREAKMLGLHEPADKRAFSIIDQIVEGPSEAEAQAETPEPVSDEPSVSDEVQEPQTTEEAASETVDDAEESEPIVEAEESQAALPDNFTVEDLASAYEVEPTDLVKKLQVKVGDELVSLEDAVNGNLRDKDYTQKTMALAEERKGFEEEQLAARNHLAQQIDQAEQALLVAQNLFPNVDMSQYAHMLQENSEAYDPAAYLRIEQQNKQIQAQIAQVADAVTAQRQQADQQYTQNLSEWRNDQIEQLKVLKPELQDAETAQKTENSWKNYLVEGAGFTPEEVANYFSGPFNAKQMMLVDKAMRYDALEAGKPKIAKKLAAKPRVVKGGTTPNKATTVSQQLQKARKRLRATGADDAALEIIGSKL
tara:strand:+ start:3828 stop:5021 length:1194 start_codon:yes stop_codon:yes gene_type:complete